MINLNINNLSKDNKAGGLDTSSFIYPLSAGVIAYKKLQLGENKKTNCYQFCDCCNTTTGHIPVVVESRHYMACVKCSKGYEICR